MGSADANTPFWTFAWWWIVGRIGLGLIVPALLYLGRVVQAQAYTMGFRDSFLIVALVFTLALIPAWIGGRTLASRRA